MKPIKLILSDQIYQIASDLSKVEDVEIGQLCAGLLSDKLLTIAQTSGLNATCHTARPLPAPEELPDTVIQVHELCRCVWQGQQDFIEAVRTTAYKFNVQESTVRDKCTRRINVQSTSDFHKLLSQPGDLLEHLCQKFLAHASNIRALFAPILPAHGAPPTPAPGTQPAPQDVPEMDLIAAIIDVLKAHGGRLAKPQVEREVFQKFEPVFQHPHYQEEIGGGVERWRKNVQFARNTACNTLGLIKPPKQSGRGIWELTKEGHTWARP